jgi:phage shock protein C
MSQSRLSRSPDRMVAGVCSGIAGHFGWSVTATRIAFVLVSLLSAAFPGLLVYIVLWVLMPAPASSGG